MSHRGGRIHGPGNRLAALSAVPGAAEAFLPLGGTERSAVLWQVHTAPTAQTCARRIAAAVRSLTD